MRADADWDHLGKVLIEPTGPGKIQATVAGVVVTDFPEAELLAPPPKRRIVSDYRSNKETGYVRQGRLVLPTPAP